MIERTRCAARVLGSALALLLLLLVVAGRAAHLQVATGTTHAATYKWLHNGAPIAGATRALLHFPCVRSSDAASPVTSSAPSSGSSARSTRSR